MKIFRKMIVFFVIVQVLIIGISTATIIAIFGHGSGSSIDDSEEIIKADGEFVGPFVDKNYTITSDVGSRPLGDDHKGIDLDHGYGAKIIALTDAKVHIAKSSCDAKGGFLGNWCPYDEAAGAGNYVILSFEFEGKTYFAEYFHLSVIKVRNGQIVKKGQVIGEQGHSGNSTGSHLHVEIHHSGIYVGSLINWVNPRVFLDI